MTKEEVVLYKAVSNWDYNFEKDELAPSVYREWWTEFYKLTWDEIYLLSDSLEVVFPKPWRTTHLLRDEPNSIFFDIRRTTPIETANEVVHDAFKDACTKIFEWEKENGKKAIWGAYKATKIDHLARIPELSVQNIDVGGDRRSLNAISKQHGPSWRMIIEMGKDKITGYAVYPGGQSGNPGSPHYNDFIEYWRTGKYYPILFLESANEENDRLISKQVWKK